MPLLDDGYIHIRTPNACYTPTLDNPGTFLLPRSCPRKGHASTPHRRLQRMAQSAAGKHRNRKERRGAVAHCKSAVSMVSPGISKYLQGAWGAHDLLDYSYCSGDLSLPRFEATPNKTCFRRDADNPYFLACLYRMDDVEDDSQVRASPGPCPLILMLPSFSPRGSYGEAFQ